jgi:asparagine synthase (glutamine-hydrolysing)
MNHLGMAFILPFFDALQAESGRGMVFLTGDGGAILKGKAATGSMPNHDTLFRYLLAKNSIFPLASVAALTGVSELDILAALEARVASYPEDDLEEKYGHFVLFDREFKLVFEGLDRNRHFFWSTSPFYGRDFFGRAMRCPAQFKTNLSLYRYFMESLSLQLVDVESTTGGRSLRLERYPVSRLARALRNWTPPMVRRTLRGMKTRPMTSVLECVREQIATQPAVAAYLSPTHASAILSRLDSPQSHILLTLTSTIEYFAGERSTLERYHDTLI